MSTYIYPRLPQDAATRKRMGEIREAYFSGGLAAVTNLAQVEDPRAAPVPTGGRVVRTDQVRRVREEVLQTLEPWFKVGNVVRTQAAFDRVLGRSLHTHLQVLPADAAHVGTWSFLTLTVFPDVAVLRFPDMHEDRLLGTPRNALRRAWLRQEILGDLLHTTERPLGEDELVGIFERPALTRNRLLLRKLAETVLQYNGPVARSEWARKLYLLVTFHSGPRVLDALSSEDIDALFERVLPEVNEYFRRRVGEQR